MNGPWDAQIRRVMRGEVGTLAGATEALIFRVESVPLASVLPERKPSVVVFVLDMKQADSLQRQLTDTLKNRFPNGFRTEL